MDCGPAKSWAYKWRDIDLDRRLLHVRRSAWYGKIQAAKSQASEMVLPRPSALGQILKDYQAQWKPNPQGFLFVTRNGRPPSSNKVVEYHSWMRSGFRGLDFTHPPYPHGTLARLRSDAESGSAATQARQCAYHPRDLRAHRRRPAPGSSRKSGVETGVGRYWTPTHYCELVESVT